MGLSFFFYGVKEKKLSRPKDKSLKAYKEWILSLMEVLSGKPQEDDWTEENWTKEWKEF